MTSTAASDKLIPDYTQAPISTSPLRGALIQTGAMFVDAYRELNSKKMFWIVLILSAVVVIGFAGVGIDDKGLTLFGMSLPLGASQRRAARS